MTTDAILIQTEIQYQLESVKGVEAYDNGKWNDELESCAEMVIHRLKKEELKEELNQFLSKPANINSYDGSNSLLIMFVMSQCQEAQKLDTAIINFIY